MINIKKFLEYVVNTIQNMKKSEKIKEEMNSHEFCEPYAIFSRLDREDKGYLVKEDFIRFLKENGVIIDSQRKTIDLFIEYYDKNFDDKLNFTEFLNFVLNKNQNLSRSITSQRETYKICCDEYLEMVVSNSNNYAKENSKYLSIISYEDDNVKIDESGVKIDLLLSLMGNFNTDYQIYEENICKIKNLKIMVDNNLDAQGQY